MARLTRLTIPGLPHHVALRGNNQQAIFHDAQDYQCLLALLPSLLVQYKVALHSYVLLPNAIYLLATPADATGLGKLMQGLGRSYVRYFNQRMGRTGTLWEGRYRSNVLQPEPYLLNVMCFHDLLPVSHALVLSAKDYEWSSHRHYVGQQTQRFLTMAPLFWKLADTPFGREAAYQAVVEAGIGQSMTGRIQQCLSGGWALGSESFIAQLTATIERRVQPGKPGRPRKIPQFDSEQGD